MSSSDATGTTTWKPELTIIVEVQACDFKRHTAAEEKLQAAEEAVMNILMSRSDPNGLKLGGTVNMTTGYDVAYESYEGADKDATLYFESAVITITAEVRA